MIWKFINTGYNDGKFNMDFDLELVKNFSGVPVLRVYKWKPYCISLGANQQPKSIDQEKTLFAGFDIVKRPTGGRAILHAEELTYSVIYPISVENTPKQIYREINLALLNGLVNFNPTLNKIQLEHTQPHFPSFYKDTKSTLCFAVSAMNELNYDGKKVVGSAQRKIGDIILQHGSILCGAFHKRIVDYLDLPSEKAKEIKNEINQTTTELETILG
jgi:lipoate-protein ligase A